MILEVVLYVYHNDINIKNGFNTHAVIYSYYLNISKYKTKFQRMKRIKTKAKINDLFI